MAVHEVGTLEEVFTYGVAGNGTADSLGVLGAIAAVLQLADSSVVVLDQYAGRAVRFAWKGNPLNTVGMGRGRGPGESMRGVSLAAVGDSAISVLDYELSRATTFRPTGEILEETAVRVPRALRHLVSGGRLWVLVARTAGREEPQLFRLAPDGRIELGVAVDQGQDLAFSGAVALAHWGGDSLVVPHQRPGVWAVVGPDGGLREAGMPLFPSLTPPGLSQTRFGLREELPSASTVSVAVGACAVVVRYMTYEAADAYTSGQGALVGHHLALYRRDGTLVGTVDFPSAERWDTKHLYLSEHTGHVFLIRILPYPSVTEYALRLRSNSFPDCGSK